MKKEYRDKNGEYSREDGPAVEWADGTKEWWVSGKRHREDNPAIEWDNGDKWWFISGRLHREDGPAREWHNGTKEWFWEGKGIMYTIGDVTESQIKEFRLRKMK